MKNYFKCFSCLSAIFLIFLINACKKTEYDILAGNYAGTLYQYNQLGSPSTFSLGVETLTVTKQNDHIMLGGRTFSEAHTDSLNMDFTSDDGAVANFSYVGNAWQLYYMYDHNGSALHPAYYYCNAKK